MKYRHISISSVSFFSLLIRKMSVFQRATALWIPSSEEPHVQRNIDFVIPILGSAALVATTGNVGLSAFVGSIALHRACLAFRDSTLPKTSLDKKETDPIARWLTYAISKSTVFSNISYSKEVLRQVINTFENGDIQDPFFSNKDLDLQLTQATKEGIFSSNAHCLDAWQLFSWLQQFSDKQDIHRTLVSTKCNIQTKPIYFTKEDTEPLLESILERLNQFNIYPTTQQIETTRNAIHTLSEGQRFALPFPSEIPEIPDVKFMIDSLIGVSPFIMPPQKNSWAMAFSTSLNTCFGKLLSEKAQWEGVPIFGKMSDKTVVKLHQQGKHPCNVHSVRLKTNPTVVHRVSVGPFIGFIHDQYHVVTSRLLSDADQMFLFEKLIPKLALMATQKKPLQNRIYNTISELSHLILNQSSAIPRKSRAFRPLNEFIQNALQLYSDSEGINPLGTYEDKYYVEIRCWLTHNAPDIHIAPDPDRSPHVVAVLEWLIACGRSTSSEFSETEFTKGQRLISNLEACLPYDGFSFRQDEIPKDVYLRFIA